MLQRLGTEQWRGLGGAPDGWGLLMGGGSDGWGLLMVGGSAIDAAVAEITMQTCCGGGCGAMSGGS